jgi:glycosyltransferase involved in cell wall biosynthesis
VRLSVIVATRNRAHAIRPCLDSIAAAIAHAGLLDAEIVVVDNSSTDNTAQVLSAWVAGSRVRAKSLLEPRVGKSPALNRAVAAAEGALLAFTDDDCRLHPEYVNDLLRHDASDTELVLRCGRIELDDPTDMPLTTNTSPTRRRWSRSINSAGHQNFAGTINGCNMTMRRALIERVGPFDEQFGPGSRFAGEDTDFIYRAYLHRATLEYVPDMTVFHHHGRKTPDVGRKLMRTYMIANGALYARYFFKHPNLCRPFYWDMKHAVYEIITGTNTFLPAIGFSYRHKVAYAVHGALVYIILLCANAVCRG